MAAVASLAFATVSAQPGPRIGGGTLHARATVQTVAVSASRATLLVTLQVDPGWHVSWRNPGETGLPTRLTWSLPTGVTVLRETWPVPVVAHTSVGATHTLEGDIPWLVQFAVDGATTQDRLATLTVKYGVCRDVCIPEQLMVQAALPGTASARPVAVPAALASRLARPGGTVPARRIGPTVLCLERVVGATGAALPEIIADSGSGIDAALPLRSRQGMALGSALVTIPADARFGRPGGVDGPVSVLFVRGRVGVEAALDFRARAPRCDRA